jgi:glycine oxidase
LAIATCPQLNRVPAVAAWLQYNQLVKVWDAIIVGAGVIGMSLGWRLRREGLRVLIIDKGEPGREASYAAGGMIAHCDPQMPEVLRPLAVASAVMYSEFTHELEDESSESPDLRDQGTLAFFPSGERPRCSGYREVDPEEIVQLEPALRAATIEASPAFWLPESCVDPRALCSALLKAAKRRGVDFVTGSAVSEIEVQNSRAAGVKTTNSIYHAEIVVNCAGAWASQIQPLPLPTRPAKGQMVCVVPGPDSKRESPLVQHVVRMPAIYLIPRSDRRILLGATVEDAGFDKRTDTETIEGLYRAAAGAVPAIREMRIHDAWAGLRPASPDELPILGATSLPGYFAATGHYRDGIMLAPITAEVITQAIIGRQPTFDLQPFSLSRFGTTIS